MTRPLARAAGLPLTQVRVCLDCDCLTVEQSCPWCDRDGTVPLSAWCRPIEPRKGNAPRHVQPDQAPARRWVLIVQHHDRDLYRVLRQALTGTTVETAIRTLSRWGHEKIVITGEKSFLIPSRERLERVAEGRDR